MHAVERDSIELWASIECSVVRIGDRYRDQLELSGHAGRLSDLDRIKDLGVRAVRYPILWERTAPDGTAINDWSWADARMERLLALDLRPIVGLVHHGSGPRRTSLMDEGFAQGLADFARAVAERYPFVVDYTPINAPLMTARFSGLQGLWYPHERSDSAFVRALLNQTRATVMAMRAIRETVPNARLVQTEEVGKTLSTDLLAYRAAFDNRRRWLSLDLLCGHVDPQTFMHRYLLESGATKAELEELVRDPCPPDVIGIDYCVSSERFLDERLERYPAHTHGGTARHPYADVEAVRVLRAGIAGHRGVLREVWERYQRPIAVTDVHIGGGREQQLRWMEEAWRDANAARDLGADVRAVTVGKTFGAFDWNSMMVASRNDYEPGAFDTRSPVPRTTAVASLARQLATTGRASHPAVNGPGWWKVDARLVYPPIADPAGSKAISPSSPRARPIVITGRRGALGKAFLRVCEQRGIATVGFSRKEMDIADASSIARALSGVDPWALVNTAGYVRVDDAEHEREDCRRENTLGPALLALACRERGVKLLTFSTDLVFDGFGAHPYLESDRVSPLGFYGLTKAEAERCVLAILPSALVVRTAALFGPWDAHNFVTVAMNTLDEGRILRAAADCVVSPTYVPELVDVCIDLLVDGEAGVWHLANQGEVSWAELARRAAAAAGVMSHSLDACLINELCLEGPRPRYSALASERGALMGTLDASLERYVRDRELFTGRRG